MSDEKRKILDMLAQGKITSEEAEKLLAALAAPESSGPEDSLGKPGYKYLRVQIEPGPGSETQDRVNIRVPFKLIRAGLKWAAFVPQAAQKQVNNALKEKGIEMDFSKIKPEDLEELVTQLSDLQVDVEGKEKIRIFCE